MKKIWKYPIRPNSYEDAPFPIKIETKQGAIPRSVGNQVNGVGPCIWIEVDPDLPPATLQLYSVGTGFGAVPEHCQYVGVIIERDYVWHIYSEMVTTSCEISPKSLPESKQ